jgi:hypothetical protein
MTIHGGDLLAEKSLWDIYKQCVRHLPPSRFNLLATSIFALVLICDCAYFPEKFPERIAIFRSVAELGLGFGSTILGFLIAGFTIFATLSKPEMFRRMYETTHRASGLSYFKVNFFAFVEVFVVYLALLVVCLATKILGAPGGFFSSIVQQSSAHAFDGYYLNEDWLANTWFVLLAVFSFYSLLALKSFIYNTYHTVITSVVWSFNPKPNEPPPKRRIRTSRLRQLRSIRTISDRRPGTQD